MELPSWFPVVVPEGKLQNTILPVGNLYSVAASLASGTSCQFEAQIGYMAL